jgi:hypothetical protein
MYRMILHACMVLSAPEPSPAPPGGWDNCIVLNDRGSSPTLEACQSKLDLLVKEFRKRPGEWFFPVKECQKREPQG